MSVLLRGESVSRHFGGLKAVDDVDFELEEGSILGLIGPNGAGKTTLFSVLAGSIPPSAGRVVLEDKDVTGWPAHRVVRAGICRTHQIVRPLAKLTVLENVQVGSRYGGDGGPRSGGTPDEAMEMLELVGLSERAEALPAELTLAGRKRLEMARALATGPRVLLLDEVIAGLNPTEAGGLADLIGKIQQQGISIIMIEHVMKAVMGLSDTVIVLDGGRKIAEGTPDAVANDPEVIAAYLGEGSNGKDGGPSPQPDSQASLTTVRKTDDESPPESSRKGLLEIKDIEVFYGDSQALYGLSLNVSEGEIVTLVGSNGAGKTTTLRSVAGASPPRSGDIFFDGQPLTEVPAHGRPDLGIVLVPEGRELWPNMTVHENISLGAFTKKSRARLDESLERVYALFPRLEERSSQLAGSLSGGEQQMAAIGRALMSLPRLLMLDEPSLGLAPILVEQVFDTVRRLHDDGLTILLVEQNLSKALEVADRGYVIETGRIKSQGSSQELLSDEKIRAAYLGV